VIPTNTSVEHSTKSRSAVSPASAAGNPELQINTLCWQYTEFAAVSP